MLLVATANSWASNVCGSGLAGDDARWSTLPPTPPLPTPDHQGHVSVAGGAYVWYGEYGSHNRGMPVLLLHGGLANSAYFGTLISELVSARYHVVAMDSRGHGRSSASSLPYSYSLMATDAVTVLDSLHFHKVDVVGWSDGGTIGYQLALSSPTRVSRLFTFGANVAVSGVKPGAADQALFRQYIARTETEYRAVAEEPEQYKNFLESISQMWASQPNWTDQQLRTVRIPVTVAIAQHDEALRFEHAEHIAETIYGANLVMLPNVSHFAMLQCPAEFDAAVIAFLKWR